MANAYRDGNNVPTLIAASSTDGATPIRVYADPTSHRLLVDQGYTAVAVTWGAGGNSKVVTDTNVTSASFISVMHATPPVGNWAIVPGSGTFTITSSDAESSSLAFSYKVFPS